MKTILCILIKIISNGIMDRIVIFLIVYKNQNLVNLLFILYDDTLNTGYFPHLTHWTWIL